MAFKIKSAKIFFGIKEHTVMLLSVVLSYFRQNRTATGYQQEEKPRRHPGGERAKVVAQGGGSRV